MNMDVDMISENITEISHPTFRERLKQIINMFRPPIVFLMLLMGLLGGVYPILCTGILHLFYWEKSKGSLVYAENGEVMGSSLIGQNFTQDKYLWGRLSATKQYPYNALESGASNFGSNNPALIDSVRSRLKELEGADPSNVSLVPVDLVTSSASGLDPHISVAAAYYQVDRVARARGLDRQEIIRIIKRYTSDRQLGLFGELRVNVLRVNLALDHHWEHSHAGK